MIDHKSPCPKSTCCLMKSVNVKKSLTAEKNIVHVSYTNARSFSMHCCKNFTLSEIQTRIGNFDNSTDLSDFNSVIQFSASTRIWDFCDSFFFTANENIT